MHLGNCESLKSIIIPKSVKSIGHGAFDKCNSLSSLVIPNTVTSVGYGIFQYCKNLQSVSIPKHLVDPNRYLNHLNIFIQSMKIMI